jgi:hypothetical protein
VPEEEEGSVELSLVGEDSGGRREERQEERWERRVGICCGEEREDSSRD